MAVRITGRVHGAAKFAAALHSIGDHVAQRQVLTSAMLSAAEPVAETAAALAPRGEDMSKNAVARRRLHESIAARRYLSRAQKRKRGGARIAQAEVFVGSTAPHAHLVEFGHWLKRGKSSRGKVLSHQVVRGSQGRIVRHDITRGPATRGRVIGRVAPKPFLRPAWDAHAASMPGRVAVFLGGAIAAAARRWRLQFERGKPTGVARRVVASLEKT